MKKIIDVCCGSKMFWYQKNRKDTIYMDIREYEDTLCDGRKLEIQPDIIADFRNIPFKDNSFKLVVFDPPHLSRVGENSWLKKKYGKLGQDWKNDIKKGFEECFRVLEHYGVLIFKWNEEQIKLTEILKLTSVQPLFGNKRAKTHWLVFLKEESEKMEVVLEVIPMDKKQYLKKGYKINLEIESRKAVLDYLRETLDGIKAVRMTERMQGGFLPSDDAMVNRINRIIEEENYIATLYDFTEELAREIDKVDDVVERALLRYRYINGWTWEEIAEKLGYSVMNTHRLHKRAVDNFNLL